MQVTEKDLIGELRGVPLEIAQAMVDEQVRQGNKSCVKVFQINKGSSALMGGFDWHKSLYGFYFWDKVLYCEGFKLFFEKYPKKEVIKNVQTPSGVNYLIINPE